MNDLRVKNNHLQSQATDSIKGMQDSRFTETSKWQGIMASINTLREGINK